MNADRDRVLANLLAAENVAQVADTTLETSNGGDDDAQVAGATLETNNGDDDDAVAGTTLETSNDGVRDCSPRREGPLRGPGCRRWTWWRPRRRRRRWC